MTLGIDVTNDALGATRFPYSLLPDPDSDGRPADRQPGFLERLEQSAHDKPRRKTRKRRRRIPSILLLLLILIGSLAGWMVFKPAIQQRTSIIGNLVLSSLLPATPPPKPATNSGAGQTESSAPPPATEKQVPPKRTMYDHMPVVVALSAWTPLLEPGRYVGELAPRNASLPDSITDSRSMSQLARVSAIDATALAGVATAIAPRRTASRSDDRSDTDVALLEMLMRRMAKKSKQ